MIQQVEADVKLVIVSPRVLAREDYCREFSKVVVSQSKMGYSMHSEFLNGQKILEDPNYLDTEVKGIISSLIESRVKEKTKKFKEPSSIASLEFFERKFDLENFEEDLHLLENTYSPETRRKLFEGIRHQLPDLPRVVCQKESERQ